MNGFPKIITDWTIEEIKRAANQGVFENEFFDLKLRLPVPKTPDEKERLSKTCAAFANSNGGFLIFGIDDNRGLDAESRIVGLDPKLEFPEQFGSYASKCNPSVQWTFLNPALPLPNRNLIHIVYVPKSWNAPHAIEQEKNSGKWLFPKRTNQGNENMNMEEIKFMFLNFYEKRIRLQLLKSELGELKIVAAQIANTDILIDGSFFSTATFDLSVINSVLAETYVLISQNNKLLISLNQIRFHVRALNNAIQMFFQRLTVPGMDMKPIVAKHTQVVKPKCVYIIEQCELALQALDEVLSTKG